MESLTLAVGRPPAHEASSETLTGGMVTLLDFPAAREWSVPQGPPLPAPNRSCHHPEEERRLGDALGHSAQGHPAGGAQDTGPGPPWASQGQSWGGGCAREQGPILAVRGPHTGRPLPPGRALPRLEWETCPSCAEEDAVPTRQAANPRRCIPQEQAAHGPAWRTSNTQASQIKGFLL